MKLLLYTACLGFLLASLGCGGDPIDANIKIARRVKDCEKCGYKATSTLHRCGKSVYCETCMARTQKMGKGYVQEQLLEKDDKDRVQCRFCKSPITPAK